MLEYIIQLYLVSIKPNITAGVRYVSVITVLLNFLTRYVEVYLILVTGSITWAQVINTDFV